ncbi:hypothetical protein V496_07048 [Pseudogymnoascus sp. VKM F-4515 (FW-2607)]|nr:hypothetical protein V496_07048 [Pseudogymnoascus sp. VKM F-4515 (FW-2607)]
MAGHSDQGHTDHGQNACDSVLEPNEVDVLLYPSPVSPVAVPTFWRSSRPRVLASSHPHILEPSRTYIPMHHWYGLGLACPCMTSHVQADTPHAGRPGGCVSKERKELILMHGYCYTATHLALHLPPTQADAPSPPEDP